MKIKLQTSNLQTNIKIPEGLRTAHLYTDTAEMSGTAGQVYLVTGGCGFLGKHLVRMLAESGEGVSEIRAFDLRPDREIETLSTDSVTVTMVQGDLTDREQLFRASEGVDVIIHVAGIVDVFGRLPEATLEKVNVEGTRYVIEACVRNGIQSCVFTSSMEVVGPNIKGQPFYRGNEETSYNTFHSNAYARSKAKAEELILKANGMEVTGGKTLHTCVLRPVGIYGESCPLLRMFYERAGGRGGRLFRFAPGTVQIGRVYVGNVAWMHLLAARSLQEKPGVLGGQAYYCYDDSPDKSHLDFTMELLGPCGVRLVGQERPVLPFALVYMLACLAELIQYILRPFYTFNLFLNRSILTLTTSTFTVQTDKAARHFGYRPLFSWDEARGRTVRWLQSLMPLAMKSGRH
ncbi:3 beta-hydroxysteroid dehydrogenase type 7-like isoform X3 [Heterodontus francisci]|uniref:3 beta-hydroxysteroid dehydrogenase type 7-like isoform X3 n=1 Tax=Heterodontus francisci TaxID=7792 RepID=UPI00355BC257